MVFFVFVGGDFGDRFIIPSPIRSPKNANISAKI